MSYRLLYYDNFKNSILILLYYYKLHVLYFQIFSFFKHKKRDCLKTTAVLHINEFWSCLSDHRINNSNHTLQGNINERKENDPSNHFRSFILSLFLFTNLNKVSVSFSP